MSIFKEAVLFAWHKNLAYGPKLIADLSAEQMAFQPAVGMNHPAWVFSHLNLYLPVIQSLLRGETFADPKEHKFGMQSKPEPDPSLYDPKDRLLQEFLKGHESIARLFAECDEDLFDSPVSLPRWKESMKKTGVALNYLMALHENIHFGQLSAWRRVQGLPPV